MAWVKVYEDTTRRVDKDYTVDPPLERTVYSNANYQAIRDQAATALTTNRTYVAIGSPTAAQTTAQVKALTRQMNGVIRILLDQLDGTD